MTAQIYVYCLWTIYKNIERIQKFKEIRDSRYIYQHKVDKTCFQHDMACKDFKDLTRRTASHKIIRDKTFDTAKNPKYDGYQRRLASLVYKFFNKTSSGDRIIQNHELAEELHKSIKRKFGKVHASFIGNIWGADLADMQLINKFKKGFRFLLCIIDIL